MKKEMSSVLSELEQDGVFGYFQPYYTGPLW